MICNGRTSRQQAAGSRQQATGVLGRVGRALLGLPARHHLVLRPTDAGIMVALPEPDLALDLCLAPRETSRSLVLRANQRQLLLTTATDSSPGETDCSSAASAPLALVSVAAGGRSDITTDSSDGEADSSVLASADVGPDLGLDAGSDLSAGLWDADAWEQAKRDHVASSHAALPVHTTSEHAAALLARLQSDPDTIGRVPLSRVRDIYADLMIELGWRPMIGGRYERWAPLAAELRRLAGSPKNLYGPRDHTGYREPLFRIHDPVADQSSEHDSMWSDLREAA